MIELYKDGNTMAILTDAKDEREFIDEASELFGSIIQEDIDAEGPLSGNYIGDWEFQLNLWLPQIVDICCKYRGYKSSVREKRVLISGNGFFGMEATHSLNRRLKAVGIEPLDLGSNKHKED